MAKRNGLDLNKAKATGMLANWVNVLNAQPRFAAQYQLDEGMNCSSGYTVFTDGPHDRPVSRIGIRRIAGLTGKVDDVKFAQATIALFHESGHVVHDNDRKAGNASPATNPDALASFLAYRNNPGLQAACYASDLNEMQVEYNAIGTARQALRMQFPDVDCDALVLDAVNQSCRNPDYWLNNVTGQGLADMTQLDAAYRMAVSTSMLQPRASRIKNAPDTRNDEISGILRPGMKAGNPWGPVSDRLREAARTSPGIEFDKMLACITLHAHPEYMTQYPALRKLDLDPRALFDMDFPESAAEIRARLGQDVPVARAARQDAKPARKLLSGRPDTEPAPAHGPVMEAPRPRPTPEPERTQTPGHQISQEQALLAQKDYVSRRHGMQSDVQAPDRDPTTGLEY